MKEKNKNIEIPLILTGVIFIITLIGSLIIIPEIKIFGIGSPETSPEPITHAGGFLSYALLVAIMISLLLFYLFSFYYDLQIFIFFLAILLFGILGTVLSYVLVRTFFDSTNFFVVLKIPANTKYSCSDECVKEVNGLIYSLLISGIIGLVSSLVAFIYLKKKMFFQKAFNN
jgi:hypothetical protein